MSKKENDAVAKILADPENSQRSAEEVADLVIGALDDVRSRTHRLAVVGQIAFPEAPETAHTVVLGPFSCRGVLDSREKFLKAVQGGSAARTAGQDLAWDARKGRGSGRFMLAPAFQRGRAAWDFFRPEAAVDPRFARITETIQRWEAGLWAGEVAYDAVCHCGTRDRVLQTSAGPVETGPCPVHGREAR
ncbi:MAG: hypothetical protein ACTHON_09265 [Humibacter sp.]